ncbi:MAG TPA: UDP-glucose 4-epimerase GalE [Frateuria sp.]|uniref:UDP-glucose 4-epimerase GalE n=1 Tax=Frateuria sp. TaxID=2211372 RepID=UPI002DEFF8A8|nr:UDP-glucose 4-epimerase GalE [Frateuria sp.]
MSRILVCGGAGYIGSHMVKLLLEQGSEVTVFDNLSTGHRAAVGAAELVVGDIRDRAALSGLFQRRSFDAVMHFCASSIVAESVSDPYAYYDNNVSGALSLLDAVRTAGVGRFIFSSTAAVYGVPEQDLIEEHHPTRPINPYGASKLMVERMLADAASAYGLCSVALRYFNAAGADPEGELGESHRPETHLIPNVLQSALGQATQLQVFGTDYDTVDGSCVRDYIHVADLAEAHLKALAFLDKHPGAHHFNLGSGSGHSVLQVIEAARQVTGRPIPAAIRPRRPGDPPVLVASNRRALASLGWQPRRSELREIVASAWRWHCDPRY